MRAIFAAVVIGGVVCSTPAMALSSKRTIMISASPKAVWKEIGGFCGIAAWHPAIEKCVLASKNERVLTLAGGGGTIREKQLSRNDAGMRYTYTILSGPLPVAKYSSTIVVVKKGAGSEVTWSGQYEAAGAPADKAQGAIDGVYSSGLEGLAKKFIK